MTLTPLLDRWRDHPARERWVIGIPVVALILAIIYLGIIEPLSASAGRLERALPGIESRHARLRAQAADIRAHPVASSSSAARSGNAASVANVAQAAIDRHALRTLQPSVERADDARVRVRFARVPFHAVWPLFEDLQLQSGIRVVALRIDRIDASQARIEATLASGESR